MAKRNRSEILQSQARAAERRANQKITGFFPFRGFTEQEANDASHNRRTGNSAEQSLLNAEKLRSRAWSSEVEKNPKLKGLQPFENRTLLNKIQSEKEAKRLANRSDLEKELGQVDNEMYAKMHNLNIKEKADKVLKVRNSSIPLAPTQFND
jgi:hypothetical protein